MREFSTRFVSQDERIEIADHTAHRCEHAGDRPSARPGAVRVSCAATQVGRRGIARSRCIAVRPLDKRATVAVASSPTSSSELLSQRWSPQQISRQLRLRFPDNPTMWLCEAANWRSVPVPSLERRVRVSSSDPWPGSFHLNIAMVLRWWGG